MSEVCTDLLAAFFFLSLAFGVGVVGYKGVRIVNRQAITAELRRGLIARVWGADDHISCRTAR
jgi:hypothetical protein